MRLVVIYCEQIVWFSRRNLLLHIYVYPSDHYFCILLIHTSTISIDCKDNTYTFLCWHKESSNDSSQHEFILHGLDQNGNYKSKIIRYLYILTKTTWVAILYIVCNCTLIYVRI